MAGSNERVWFVGTLLHDYGPLDKGTVVFTRRVTLRLAVGPCWWIRPQGQEHFWMIAESFGGEQLRFIVKLRHRKIPYEPLQSPPSQTEKLNEELKRFTNGLHPMATPYQLKRSIYHVKRPTGNRNLRASVNLDQANGTPARRKG